MDKHINELGLTGPGVEPVSIPEIDEAADKYERCHAEMEVIKEELEGYRLALMEALNNHRAELLEEPNGGYSYRYEDRVVKLVPGKEKLSVKSIHEPKAETSFEEA